MVKVFCDMCGREIDYEVDGVNLDFNHYGVVNFKTPFSAEKQLCLSCAARVRNFVENSAKWTEVTAMRLIDGDVLWEKLDDEPWYDNADRDEIALPIVAAAPTVDAVVVTRCKDCRNHRELNRKDRLESGYAEGVLWCMNRSDGVWADGFCSDGESKEV